MLIISSRKANSIEHGISACKGERRGVKKFCTIFEPGQIRCAEAAHCIQEDAAAERMINEAPACLC